MLDPFCGAGTMLIERAKYGKVKEMFGLDILAKVSDNSFLSWRSRIPSGCGRQEPHKPVRTPCRACRAAAGRMNGREMFAGSVREAVSYGANTFMVYTGAPQNTRRKRIDEMNLEEGFRLMKENGIEEFARCPSPPLSQARQDIRCPAAAPRSGPGLAGQCLPLHPRRQQGERRRTGTKISGRDRSVFSRCTILFITRISRISSRYWRRRT